MACDTFDSPQERAIREWERAEEARVNEWLTEGKCWFKGEALTEVKDRAGSSYSIKPESSSGFNDNCVFDAATDMFEPYELTHFSGGTFSAIQAGDYYFQIERTTVRNTNLPPSVETEWRIYGCAESVERSARCSGEPTWEIFRSKR